ncbi:hypothetical protein [Photobacterium halotolerans]|uniref:Uncharacterized protein n=1 Tax=Photobacterium halotolerans TaxID=265726 RepID=A0A7X5AQY2_9GAMM|nr:hypothetical protein [Photobacterium halotolerans]NAW64534.1 hypothetical protein [Photobacterium halotolerans]
MAGTAHYDRSLTEKSLMRWRELRERFGLKTGRTSLGCVDWRYSRTFQTMARRAAAMRGGVV